MALTEIIPFFGWMTVINFGVLILTSIVIITMRGTIAGVHAGMFGMSEGDMAKQYFSYLAHYKIFTLIFVAIPYVALKMMG